MNLLTVDTSTSSCSVALTSGDRLLAERLVCGDRPMSSRILTLIQGVLQDGGLALDDLNAFAVALGPGAFTGLRVGIATVKGLALATGLPVAGFSSLAMLAMNLPWSALPVCPMFDARKNEVYTALYRCEGLPEAILDDAVLPPAAMLARLEGPTLFVGDGAVRYGDLIVATLGDRALFAPASAHQPRAASGALLARAALAAGDTPLSLLNPLYIRPSEAELAKAAQRI